MTYGNASQSYDQRNAVDYNIGEELFEMYCDTKGWEFRRIGFDEKHNSVPNFFKMSKMLRNLPDYVVTKDDLIYIVNVKGTNAIKQSERMIMPGMIKYFSSDEAPLMYAFCARGKPIRWCTPSKLMELYDQQQDRQWSDGKIYRLIPMEGMA
jgi:hypothetical protein